MKTIDARSRPAPAPDKRRHRRYHVKNVTWAVVSNGGGRSTTAQVMDIGGGGLSVHSGSPLKITQAGARLDLIVSRNGFHIDRIPFQPVSRSTLPPQIPFGPKKWRYGLKFGKLSQAQQAKLDAFIAKHTIGHFTGSRSS
jgi:hypothetical protein